MNGLAIDVSSGNAVKGSKNAGDRESGTEGIGFLPCGSPDGPMEPADTHVPDLRWLGIMSCMGSALITIAGSALITGHLLLAGDGKMVAEDQGSAPGYSVAAGSDK